MSKQFKTSIFPDDQVQLIQTDQARVPTWSVVLFLFVFFFVLKSFIYIKDKKRHGK